MVGFRIHYLRGVVTAADVSTGQEKSAVEWPPHPDRLFCALTQAWADLGQPADGAEALRALETWPPPHIQCGELLGAQIRTRYVPVNDRFEPFAKDGTKLAQTIQGTALGRDRKGRSIPQAPLEDSEAIMFWPDVTPKPAIAAALRRLARQVSHLGHSSSFVSVALVTDDKELQPTHIPDLNGRLTLRVPFAGRFEELLAAYSQRKTLPSWPPPALGTNYTLARQSVRVSEGSHGECIFFQLLLDGPALPLAATARLLSVWRKALLANSSQQPVPEILSGHAEHSTPDHPLPSDKPHLALITLPDVGHDFAAGHLMGVGAVLPRNISPEQRLVCLNALSTVREIHLGALGSARLSPVNAQERRRALLPGTWSAESRTWASVTPVVLGKYPKRLFSEETCRIVEEACLIAGLPRPASITVGPVPWVAGSPPAAGFPPFPSRQGKPRRAHVHARLEFDHPVRGPVLIGAGRHLGYGVFRQLRGAD